MRARVVSGFSGPSGTTLTLVVETDEPVDFEKARRIAEAGPDLLAFAERFVAVKDLASLQDFEWVSLRENARSVVRRVTL